MNTAGLVTGVVPTSPRRSLFILALGGLSPTRRPRVAATWYGIVGMGIALVATIWALSNGEL